MEGVSKRRRESKVSFWLKLISAFLVSCAFLGLLGSLGFSIGKPIYSIFTTIMRSLAWAGPFLCLGAAVLLWMIAGGLSKNSPKTSLADQIPDQMQKSKSQDDTFPKGISLPAGKLVSMHGFDQYFSSPEMLEMKDVNVKKADEMNEMGTDFPSYFGTDESFYPGKSKNIMTLKGLKEYIEKVDEEEGLEQKHPWHDHNPIIKPTATPMDEPPMFSSVFKSQAEQEEFLAPFKSDRNLLRPKTANPETANLETSNPETLNSEKVSLEKVSTESSSPETVSLETASPETSSPEKVSQETAELGIANLETTDLVANLRDNGGTIDDAVKLAQVVDSSGLNTELRSLDIPEAQVAEAQAAAALELKPNNGGRVIQLFDKVQDQAELQDQQDQLDGAEEAQSGSTVEKAERWKLPDFDLLEPVQKRVIIQDTETSEQLEKVLLNFGVKAKVIRVTRGPVITRFELAPAPGVKISKIVNLADDIALGLAARDVRIEAPIPGKAAIGIEVPNKEARSVSFREVLETPVFDQSSSKLKIALGKDIADQPIIGDLIKMPHLLVAGATGSGKSVCITSIINSILCNATPDEVKFLLVDPKMVELSQYNGIPHLLAPVVVDPKKAASALQWIVKEMENRYELLAAAGVRDIERYNKMKAGESNGRTKAMPFIVVIIDELADLMMVAAKEVEEAICRLAQMARAAGIHLVIATQRPSVDVITGLIKANIPSRISFAVSSQIDSRTILDATGAEKLLGRGDMLYSPLGENKALRVQGCLVTDEEVQRIITHWKGLGKPEYLDPEHLFAETKVKNEESNGPDDELFIEAGQLFIRTGMASISYLQRKLKLGYSRAARLMDILQEQGVVGNYEGSKPRQVLLTMDEFNERFG